MSSTFIRSLIDTLLIQEKKQNYIEGVLLVGSAVWNNCIDEVNDIDVEVFLNTKSSELFIFNNNVISHDVNQFILKYERLNIDYLSCKYDYCGKSVSLHFTPIEKIDHFSSINLSSLSETICTKELRYKRKEKDPIYHQRNFAGEIFDYEIPTENTQIGYISSTPLAIINNNRLHLGLVQDKLLSGKIIQSTKRFQLIYKTLINNIYDRCKKEETAGYFCDIKKSLCRYENIPPYYLDLISQNYENYKKNK